MAALDELNLHLVEDWETACEFKEWLGNRRDFLGFDVETTGLHVMHDRIRLCQFGDRTDSWAFDWSLWKGLCKETLETYAAPMVAHNLLYDSKMLKAEGVVVPQRWAHDTMAMTFLKDPAFRMDLKGAAARYVDRRAAVGQSVLKAAMSAAGWDWATVPIRFGPYWQYACLDTSLTSMLATKLYADTALVHPEAYDLELAHIHVQREAELAGLLTDPDYIDRASARIRARLHELHPQIPVEATSDYKVRKYLLNDLGIPLFAKTESGALSVDKHVLAYWTERGYPVCGLIREYRSLSRMLGSYLEKFAERGTTEKGLALDGVLRASCKPLGAFTGRQSVTDPPLQTLPRGRMIRDAIVAREGHKIVMADFKGMEMRVLASFAQETAMLEAFGRGEDLHDFVATAAYGENFTKQNRDICKNAGFAKIYGAGLEQFATTAKIEVGKAKEFLDRYDVLFPEVKSFMDLTIEEVRARSGNRKNGRGYVELMNGVRLPVSGDKAYVGVNFKIQGSCAITTKKKVVELAHAGLEECFRLSVHDELLCEVPDEDVREAREIVRRTMPEKYDYPGVVLEIDDDVVDRWGQHYAKDYEAWVETPAMSMEGVA